MLDLLNSYAKQGWFGYRVDGSGINLNCDTCLEWLEDDMFYTNVLRGLEVTPAMPLIISLRGTDGNIDAVNFRMHPVISKYQFEIEHRDGFTPAFHIRREYKAAVVRSPESVTPEKEVKQKSTKSK